MLDSNIEGGRKSNVLLFSIHFNVLVMSLYKSDSSGVGHVDVPHDYHPLYHTVAAQ